jgi:hypothetical protein
VKLFVVYRESADCLRRQHWTFTIQLVGWVLSPCLYGEEERATGDTAWRLRPLPCGFERSLPGLDGYVHPTQDVLDEALARFRAMVRVSK